MKTNHVQLKPYFGDFDIQKNSTYDDVDYEISMSETPEDRAEKYFKLFEEAKGMAHEYALELDRLERKLKILKELVKPGSIEDMVMGAARNCWDRNRLYYDISGFISAKLNEVLE